MEVLFIVLNDAGVMENLLNKFKECNFKGGTILDSQGIARSFEVPTHEIYHSYLKTVFNEGRSFNKTLFMVIDSERIEEAKEIVRQITGGLSRENIGIMFTFPVSSAEGLTK